MENDVKNIVEDIRSGIKGYEDKAEKLEKELVGVNAELLDVKQKVASFSAPKIDPKSEKIAEFAKNLIAKNAVSTNGAGAVEVASEIVRGMVDKNKLLSKVRTFYGDYANVNIPVMYPGMAQPAAGAEGSTGFSADTTAVLGATSLTPYPFCAYLGVDRLALYTTSLERDLINVFDDAFGQAWENQILNGTGASNQFTGIFQSAWIASVASAASSNIQTAASATATTWKEFAKLARAAKAKATNINNVALIVHPDVISGMITASGASSAIEQEFLSFGTIAGVQVIESTFAPSTQTTGLYVGCACDLNSYAGAFVRSLEIEPIKVKGDANIYEQAFVYANGKPLVKGNFFYLKQA